MFPPKAIKIIITDKKMSQSERELENIQDKLEKLNPIDLLSPNEVLDNIQISDKTVEVVGFVERIKGPYNVGNKAQYKLFKFILNNGKGRSIQVIAWDEVIESIMHHIIPNNIIRLGGVQVHHQKLAYHNNETVFYELLLLICPNTIVSNLGKYEEPNDRPLINLFFNKPIPTKLSDVMNISQRILLEAYIKTDFTERRNNKFDKPIGCGSLTDGNFEIEVHIINFSDDEYFNLGIKRGDKIKIIGVMQTTVNPVHLRVNDLTDIRQLSGRMELISLLKGVNIPEERKIEEDSTQEVNYII